MRVQIAGGALAIVVGALLSACGEGHDPVSAEHSGEDGYVQCLRDAGLNNEEIALFTEREPGEGRTLSPDDHPDLDTLVKASAECVVASGIGESGLTPERIAEDTAAWVGLSDCMHGRGWHEFPDPEPNPWGGLSPTRAEIPPDADQRAQFLDDLDECSIEHLDTPLGGPIDDEGNPVGGGTGEEEDDHSDHDH